MAIIGRGISTETDAVYAGAMAPSRGPKIMRHAVG